MCVCLFTIMLTYYCMDLTTRDFGVCCDKIVPKIEKIGGDYLTTGG